MTNCNAMIEFDTDSVAVCDRGVGHQGRHADRREEPLRLMVTWDREPDVVPGQVKT